MMCIPLVGITGVWAASDTDVFAVGAYDSQLLHYDGTAWTQMTCPTSNVLNDVWGSSADNVFAVGQTGTIIHYDGTAWSTMSSGTSNTLNAVWGDSPNSVFAVGDYGTMLHYDGTAWSQYASISYGNFSSVWGIAADNVYTVDTYGRIIHYDGSGWTIVSDIFHELYGLWISPDNEILAVGMTGTIVYDGYRPSDTPPLVTITSPTHGAMYSVDDGALSFSATAADQEDGDLGSQIAWVSNLDGAFVPPAVLSIGTHSITATTMDTMGQIGSDTIDIIISPHANVGPSLTISSPSDGATYSEIDTISFAGMATDPEEGDLSDDIRWSSDLDGSLGSGALVPATLSPGNHMIIAAVTDAGGLSATDSISLAITVHVNTAPTVDITAPVDGGQYSEDDGALAFTATATDLEDGDLSGSVVWSSDIDGAFTSPAALSVATHHITAEVTDSGGLSATDNIVVTITAHVNTAPTINIAFPRRRIKLFGR